MGKEGFWIVDYTGLHGHGFGIVTLDTGMVVGADAAGSIWDGEYEYNQKTDAFDLKISITLPPHVVDIITGQSSDSEHTELFELSLPNDFDEREVAVQTSLGPVNVRFRKIRDFPRYPA